MRVLIAGAGVGGLAAARALHVDSHDVTVFERSADLRRTGAVVTLWSNGTGILSELGASLDGTGALIDVLEQRDYRGRVLIRADVARSAAHYGHPNVCLPRHRLLERLAGGLPPGLVVFGHACAGFDQDQAGVRLKFADGTTADGDLLVGADGRASAVRDQVWGADPAEPSGWVTWQGVSPIPTDVTSSRRGVMLVGPEGLCGLMPAGEGLLQWWFDQRWTPGTPAPRVAGGRAPGAFRRLGRAGAGRAGRHRRRRRGVLPALPARGAADLRAGRVTLAGDAAHSMPPTRAQRANQALEDAWALARALRDVADPSGPVGTVGVSAAPHAAAEASAASPVGPTEVPAALRGYERARWPKVSLVARRSATEDTNAYRPLLSRLVPNALTGFYYTRWLARVSNYLTS